LADIFVIKNVHTRLLITLIEHPGLAFLAALLPIPNNFYNEQRDRFLYRIVWRLKTFRSSSPYPFEDPTLELRNRTMRLRNLHIETTFEIICIFVAVCAPTPVFARHEHALPIELQGDIPACCSQSFFVWRFGIQRDGLKLLEGLVMQVMVECLQSLACNLWYEVVERQPTLSVPLLRVRGWTVMVTIMAVTMWCVVVSTIAPRALGRLLPNADWVFLTNDVLSQINRTRLCEQFSDATFFAHSAGCP
jgi:hypothetical protein